MPVSYSLPGRILIFTGYVASMPDTKKPPFLPKYRFFDVFDDKEGLVAIHLNLFIIEILYSFLYLSNCYFYLFGGYYEPV